MNKSEVLVVRRQGDRGWQAAVGLIAAALIAQGLFRAWVAIELLMTPGIEGQFGALVHWRVYDSFAGWIAVLVLAMVETSPLLRRAEIVLLAAGLAGMVTGLLLGDVGGRAIVEIGAALLLAAGTMLVAWRQIIALAKSAGKVGLDMEQLWRAAALQWAMLWVTVEVVLRIQYWRDGVESDERARAILFLLPVVVATNVIMAMGIRWWNSLRGSPSQRPRIRAWLVAMGAVNLGAVLCVVGIGVLGKLCSLLFGASGPGIASASASIATAVGVPLMIAGIAMYFVGFPRAAWKNGGAMVPAAFGVLAVGLAMMAFDGMIQREFYTFAWRHLLASVCLLWLIGMGGMAMSTLVSERLRPRGAALASAWMVLIGVCATAAIFLAGIQDRSSLQGLFLGTVLQSLGIIVGGAALLRAGRSLGARN